MAAPLATSAVSEIAVGGVAQLVEHLVCNQVVVGSNPIASTNSACLRFLPPLPLSVRELMGCTNSDQPPVDRVL